MNRILVSALLLAAIAAPFMPTAACCEGDGALAKKDVIGAAGFCGVAFLADIVNTIERLSLISVCHLGTCTVSGRSCLLPRARSPCERPMANNAIDSWFFELGFEFCVGFCDVVFDVCSTGD